MALTERISPPRVRIARRSPLRRLIAGGTDGNEQLTAVAGVVLLVLFAVLGVTILAIGQLLWLHLFLGVALVGPVALKLASTGYRFTRYYTSSPAYRRKGPPPLLMRALGPFVILTTVAVFFTGLLLLLDGPNASSGLLRELHKLTFFAWLVVLGVHVLWHLPELPAGVRAVRNAERRARNLPGRSGGGLPGSNGRGLVLLAALAGGLVLAVLFLHDIHIWTSATAYHPHHIHLG